MVDEVGVEGAVATELHVDEDALPGRHDLMDVHDVELAHPAHDMDLSISRMICCCTAPNLDR
jgi:hypothetical protein